MRKRLYATLAVLISATAVYVGCDASGTQAIPSDESLANGLALPEGTQIWEETEEGVTTLWFRLPETHKLIGRDLDSGVARQEPGAGITCTCTEGSGGCSPFRASGGGREVVGCAMDAGRCTNCNMSARTLGEGGTDPGTALADIVVVDLERPIKIVETRAEAAALRCATSVLLDDSEVRDAVSAFLTPFQGPDPSATQRADPGDPHGDVVTAPVDVFGHLMWLPVRLTVEDVTDSDVPNVTSELMWDRYVVDPDVAANVPGDGNCTCESGGGGCRYERRRIIGVGMAEWCEAGGCNSCTLH